MVALAPVGCVALFFCHLMGLLFFYVLIAGYELQRLWPRRRQISAVLVSFAALLPLALVPLGLYLVSPLASLSDATEFSSLAVKFRQLILPFANYILPLDIATACIVGAFLLACFAKGWLRVSPIGGLPLLLTALLFLAAPFSFKGTYLLDTRFVILLGFLLFGAVLPIGLPRAIACCRCHRVHLAVRRPHGHRRLCMARTSDATSRTCAPSSHRSNPGPASLSQP